MCEQGLGVVPMADAFSAQSTKALTAVPSLSTVAASPTYSS